MARDYKHRTSQNKASKSKKSESTVPVRKWLLVLIIVAAFISFLLWLKSTATTSNNKQQTVAIKPKKQAIKYDFYNVLPEREVVIPEYQIETQKRLERQKEKHNLDKNQPPTLYMIQAGAFEIYREADKRKAQLTLLGQNAFIEKVVMEGKTWHRVKIGSFSSLNKADTIRQQLKDQNIQSVIMKQKS
jgi:cell division protein FtsN